MKRLEKGAAALWRNSFPDLSDHILARHVPELIYNPRFFLRYG